MPPCLYESLVSPLGLPVFHSIKSAPSARVLNLKEKNKKKPFTICIENLQRLFDVFALMSCVCLI